MSKAKYFIFSVLMLLLLAACDGSTIDGSGTPTVTLDETPTKVVEVTLERETPQGSVDKPIVKPADNPMCGRFPPVDIAPVDAASIDFVNNTISNRVTITGDPSEIAIIVKLVSEDLGIEAQSTEQSIDLPTPAEDAPEVYRVVVVDPELTLEVLAFLNRLVGPSGGSVALDPQNEERILVTVAPSVWNNIAPDIQRFGAVAATITPFTDAAEITQYQWNRADVDAATFAENFNQMALARAVEQQGTELSALPVAELAYIGGDNGGSYIGADFGGGGVVPSNYVAFVDQPPLAQIGRPAANMRDGKDGVTVFVFDSSPLAHGPYSVQFGEKHEPYILCNHALISPNAPLLPSEPNSHGFFAANLIHEIAPDSNIHLVQVLQYAKVPEGAVQYEAERDQLYTDLHTLETALNHYLSRLESGEPAVVNLSLGLRRAEVPNSLHELIVKYEGRGVVFAAAAGNRRGEPMQAPASHELVLGVAASYALPGAAPQPACYSDTGDIAAPGGNDIEGDCEPRISDSCSEQHDPATAEPCLHGILSLSMHAPDDPMFAYWLGTSFSTPLVSGAAALALEHGATTPDQVRKLLLDTTVPGVPHFGRGILHIDDMLSAIGP